MKYRYLNLETIFVVTGTFHGSIVLCHTEGEARRIFHKQWNGESILHIEKQNYLP